MKRLIKYYVVFFLVFIFSFFLIYVLRPLRCDDVWLYGFSYNISRGLVIYRDFNVVTTPLYYFIGCLFIRAFGSYIIVMGIFNSLLFAFIMLMMYKRIGLKSFILYPLLLIFFPNGYNFFSLFWLVVILYLNWKECNDWKVPFVIGLLFVTKQSVGIVVFFIYLFYSKYKSRDIVVFLVPFVIISIYLIFKGAFFQFIDYCFLGMLEFGGKNHYHELIFVIFEVVILLYLLVRLFRSKFCDRECAYILCFQIILYPLVDAYHFFVSFFPVMYLIVKDIRSKNILLLLFFMIFFMNGEMFFLHKPYINFKRNVLYLTNSGYLTILMEEFHDYLKDWDNYYFTGYCGYLYKLYWDIPIGNFDLWNNGNMGYGGFEKRIFALNDKCSREKCVFIVDADLFENKKSQVFDFYSYIAENYTYKEEHLTFDIYVSG